MIHRLMKPQYFDSRVSEALEESFASGRSLVHTTCRLVQLEKCDATLGEAYKYCSPIDEASKI